MAPIPPTPDAASDVTGTLAELERKLRELEQELTSLGRGRGSPGPTHRAPFDAAPRVPLDATPRPPLDPARSFPETATPVTRDSAPLPRPPVPPSAREFGGRLIDEAAESRGSLPTSERRADPPPYETQASADAPSRSGGPSDAQLAGLADLRRFGARLEQFTRELTEDYEQVLERVLTGFSSATNTPSTEDALFEGHVELGVGPFYDIGSLSLFERHVAALRHASDVAVRRFEASHAVLDLRLSQPVALVRELRAVLDTEFSVREIDGGRLMLTFDDV